MLPHSYSCAWIQATSRFTLRAPVTDMPRTSIPCNSKKRSTRHRSDSAESRQVSALSKFLSSHRPSELAFHFLANSQPQTSLDQFSIQTRHQCSPKWIDDTSIRQFGVDLMKAHCQLQWLPPTSTFERPRTTGITRSNVALNF